MSFLEQFDTITLETWIHNRKTFNRKSGILWGNKWNVWWVILYLYKPRKMKQEDFEEILDKINISFKK